MNAAVGFFKLPDQLVVIIQLFVPVRVLIEYKDCAGQPVHKRIFAVILHTMQIVNRFGFDNLYGAANQRIIHLDFDDLTIRANINVVLLWADGVKRRTGNFRNNPVPNGDVLKGERAILCGFCYAQCGFLGNFFGIWRKQANDCAF